MFYKLGAWIYKFRVLIICIWLVLGIALSPFITDVMSPFQSTGFIDKNSSSAITQAFLDKNLKFNTNNQFILLFHSKSLKTTDPQYIRQLKKALSKLDTLSIKPEVIYPSTLNKQISKDKHSAYVIVVFKTSKPLSPQSITQFKAAIQTPKQMTLKIGGEAIFIEQVNQQTQKDLYTADFIATPVSIVVLILVFGSLIAALVPMCLGGGCALIILTTLYFLGQCFNLSIFTINIALLLGLCLSLDYALFIISRFRTELTKHAVEIAIARTQATAGRAVFFSGLAVFISLSALLLFPINILFSIGVGGLVAVFIAVSIALFLLPAVLGVLDKGIDCLSVKRSKIKSSRWKRIAKTVVNHPLMFFLTTLTILVLLGAPFLNVKFGLSDYHILPERSESRSFFDAYHKAFNDNTLNPIQVVLVSSNASISSKGVHHVLREIKDNQYVGEIHEGVERLFNPKKTLHFTVIDVISKYPANSTETKSLINDLRQITPGHGLTLKLTGTPVKNDEVFSAILRIFPYAMLWIIVLTYLILLFLLRSLFLPLKAIIMNIISLSASYGVLVFVFQEGHLHELLNFDPQGLLDISLLIIIFCALFGFSMDYEVFLLSRIQEAYQKTKDNKKSIIFGIEQSSRIITSAAVIVICICGSFMFADVLMVKAFGLGIAVAVFVDAFVVRTLLVPSTMALLDRWNWYFPKWLDKIIPK